jgi:hypothetical protein
VVDGPVGRRRDLGHRRGGGAERVVDIRGAAAQVDQPGLHLHRLIIDQLQERRDIDDLEPQLAQAVAQPPARPAILVQPGTSFGGSRGVGGRSRGRMGLLAAVRRVGGVRWLAPFQEVHWHAVSRRRLGRRPSGWRFAKR